MKPRDVFTALALGSVSLLVITFTASAFIRFVNRPDIEAARSLTVPQSVNVLLLSASEYLIASANAVTVKSTAEAFATFAGSLFVLSFVLGVWVLIFWGWSTLRATREAEQNRIIADAQ